MAETATPTKSDTIREYLKRHPNLTITELSRLIMEETGVDASTRLIGKVRTKMKSGKTTKKKSTPSTPSTSTSTPAAVAAPAPSAKKSTAAPVSEHIANIKSAVEKLGKDEVRRILELF